MVEATGKDDLADVTGGYAQHIDYDNGEGLDQAAMQKISEADKDKDGEDQKMKMSADNFV